MDQTVLSRELRRQIIYSWFYPTQMSDGRSYYQNVGYNYCQKRSYMQLRLKLLKMFYFIFLSYGSIEISDLTVIEVSGNGF